MKSYYYVPESVILLDGKKILGKVKEFEFTFNMKDNYDEREGYADLTKHDISFHHEPVSLNCDIELNDEIFKQWISPKICPFRQFTVVHSGYITEKEKRMWYELQEKGHLFALRFRQLIYPKLQVHVTFLTHYKQIELKDKS